MRRLNANLLHRLCPVLLPNSKAQVVPIYGGLAFDAEAKERLPGVDFSDCDGAIHLVMGRLADAGREAIGAGNLPFLQQLFAFVARATERPEADREIENAVVISFLEPSDFTGSHGALARDLLPDRLRALIHEAV